MARRPWIGGPDVTENFIMKSVRFLVFLVPALALAMPTVAQVRPVTLSDSQEPGSVIVFPKFVQGTINLDGVTTPMTEIEVGVVCPKGVTCPEHQPVKIRFHWVCGAVEGVNSQICRENNFDITTTVNGKVVFGPDGIPVPGESPRYTRHASRSFVRDGISNRLGDQSDQ
jgi:hypothetical protein